MQFGVESDRNRTVVSLTPGRSNMTSLLISHPTCNLFWNSRFRFGHHVKKLFHFDEALCLGRTRAALVVKMVNDNFPFGIFERVVAYISLDSWYALCHARL